MKYRILNLIILCLMVTTLTKAQVAINEDDSHPDASALLDIKSTTKGMLIPRMTTTQRASISNPAQGLFVYDTETKTFWYYDNSKWNEIVNGANVITKNDLMQTQAYDFTCHGLVDTVIIEGTILTSVGNYLYTGTDSDSLITYDFSNRTSPTVVSRIEIGVDIDGARNIFALHDGNYLYLTGKKGVQLIDITFPNNPIAKSLHVPFSGTIRDADTDGNYLYVCGSYSADYNTGIQNGLQIYEASNPNNFVLKKIFTMPTPYGVAKKDNLLYLSAINDSLHILNVSDASNPTLVTKVFLSQKFYDLEIQGNYLYGRNTVSDAIVIYDITNPTNPILKSTISSINSSTAKNPRMHFNGNYLYLASSSQGNNTYYIYDITDKASPILKASQTVNNLKALAFINDILYVQDNSKLIGVRQNCPTVPTTDPFNSGTTFDNQAIDVLNLNGSTLEISLQDDGQATKTLDLTSLVNTDNQDLSLSGNTLSLSNDATAVDLSSYVNTDNQDLSLSGNTLSLTNDNSSVDLSGFKDNTDNQDLSLSGNTLSLTNDNSSVDLTAFKDNTDNQDLSLSGNTLSLTNDATAVTLPWSTSTNDIQSSNSGNVGIGISPSKKLDVNGNGQFSADGNQQLTIKNSVNNANPVELYFDRTAAGPEQKAAIGVGDASRDFFIWHNGLDRFYINENGLIGIGRTPATNKLEVEGDASKSTAGDWLANSDARLKKNITPLSAQNTLDKLLQLQGVTYEWNDDKTGTQRPAGVQYGFTAQNIQAVFPTLVNEDNLGYLQTAYGTYDAMYVEAFRALNDKVEKLEKENAALKIQAAKINQLEAMLQALQEQVNGEK